MAKANIFKSDDFSFSVFLTQPKTSAQKRQSSFMLFLGESDEQDAHVLAGTETVQVRFAGQSGTPVTRTIGSGAAFGTLANGEIVISGDETVSALLLADSNQAFDIVVTAGAITTTYERSEVLDVKNRKI